MKVICDRATLVDCLNLVGGVIVSRTPKPVLTCVKITAENDALVLAATDLEVAISITTAKVQIEQPGETLAPADKLGAIVRESVDPTLTLETEQDATHITGTDCHFKILGYPVGDFPPVPGFDGEADFTIAASDLTQLIHQTIYATARETSRYAINGVLVEREANKLALVGCDSHRLALAKGHCKAKDKDKRSAIVPTKALNMLLRVLDDPEQNVKVRVADNQILFATDTAVLCSNLVEGNFPPYKDVIPRDSDKKATLDTGTLASAVRRAALLTNEESKGVKLNFADSALKLTSRAPEMGEAEINLECPRYDGDPLEIGFNPNYLLDVLKVVDTDQIQLEMRAGNKPAILTSGPNFLYVIMPVTLQS